VPSKKNTSDHDRLIALSRRQAIADLVQNHRDEYNALLEVKQTENGVTSLRRVFTPEERAAIAEEKAAKRAERKAERDKKRAEKAAAVYAAKVEKARAALAALEAGDPIF